MFGLVFRTYSIIFLKMVIVEICGLLVSGTRVVCQSFSKAIHHAIASNAPNGNFLQKFCGAFFGTQFATTMTLHEARDVLGYGNNEQPNLESIQERLAKMTTLNDIKKGGSPYLNDRFLAASHVLAKAKYNNNKN